jgi:hypothetical protein
MAKRTGTPSRREGSSVGTLELPQATPSRRKKVPVEREYGAPRGAARSGGMEEPTCRLSQQPAEAGGSPGRGDAGAGESSLDNDGTGRHCQTARVRQARRKGVRTQKPVVEPPQVFPPAPTWRIWAGQQCTPDEVSDDSLALRTERREATVKACGVTVARLQGKSWTPTPPTDRW